MCAAITHPEPSRTSPSGSSTSAFSACSVRDRPPPHPTTVDILLAACNGERFLPAQLDSLFAQRRDSGFTIRILARDDASTDRTPDILREYAARCSAEEMKILPPGSRGGAAANFGVLLTASDADFSMFCDQDDLWAPDKVVRSLAALRDAGLDPEVPALLYSDLEVVDAEGVLLNPSKFRACGQRDEIHDPVATVLCNVLSGCTMTISRGLRRIALPFPPGVLMHDYWLNVVAALCGAHYLRLPGPPPIRWRQHGRNVSERGSSYLAHKISLLKMLERERRITVGILGSLPGFAGAHPELSGDSRELLFELARLPELTWFGRTRFLLRHLSGKLAWTTILSRIYLTAGRKTDLKKEKRQ